MNKEQFLSLARQAVCDLPYCEEDPLGSSVEPDELLEVMYEKSQISFHVLLLPDAETNRMFLVDWNSFKRGYLSITPLWMAPQTEVRINHNK